MIELTNEEILEIWNNIPTQNDPTGKKFAQAFGRAIIAAMKEKHAS